MNAHESTEVIKNGFHSISKLMNEKQDEHIIDEEKKSLSDKEIENDLNDSQTSENPIETDLLEYIKSQIEKNINDLNNSREDFDRLTRQIIEKVQHKFSLVHKNHIIKQAKKVLINYDFDFSLDEFDSSLSPTETKQSRASSSSGYTSLPSPSSSSSSASSQKHSIKTDLKSTQHKKFKTSPDQPTKSPFYDFKSIGQKPGLPANMNPFWNQNLFDPELLRLANSNPLLRFPDMNTFNPYFNNFQNLFRPNMTSTPSSSSPSTPTPAGPSFTPPIVQKKENGIDHKMSTNNNHHYHQNGKNMPKMNKNESSLTSTLASSKLKLSSKLSKLSSNEIQTVKSLITSYRESAAFLSRSADELEQLINEYHDN